MAVASGDGFEALFGELGVDKMVLGGQTMNPSCEDIYAAVNEIDAKAIFILPNNKNIIMTATQVAEMTDKEIIVIPTRNIPQGINAMLCFDESATVEENRENMVASTGAVSTMQITYAARNSNFDGMDIKEGDYLALYEEKLMKCDSSIDSLIEGLAEKIKENQKSMVSIYYGQDVTEEDAGKIAATLTSLLGDIEINVYEGGQPVYYYIISAE